MKELYAQNKKNQWKIKCNSEWVFLVLFERYWRLLSLSRSEVLLIKYGEVPGKYGVVQIAINGII